MFPVFLAIAALLSASGLTVVGLVMAHGRPRPTNVAYVAALGLSLGVCVVAWSAYLTSFLA